MSSRTIESSSDNANAKKQSTKDLSKTKLCVYYAEKGHCRHGSECLFAHSATELRGTPNLKKTQMCSKFLNGLCDDPDCNFAHGEKELRQRPNLKKKLCTWYRQGKCRNGDDCGFAHGREQLRAFGPPPGLSLMDPPPGLSLDDVGTNDFDTPEKEYFRFMARRGSAPLEQQVQSMASAIKSLECKLAQLQDHMAQSEIFQMQQCIEELTMQCGGVQTELGVKTRLNAKAEPYMPSVDCASDDSTSVGSD
jgi:hypothetical protein